MKKVLGWCLCLAAVVQAAPVRVLMLDFEDHTGMPADARLGGMADPVALAAKGSSLLAAALLDDDRFVLIDRRDFTAQMERHQAPEAGFPATASPSFLHAAQALRADVVLRGNLMSFSTGKQQVDQGGYQVEFATASLRVGLDALDAVDGTVLAVINESASRRFRQTDALRTILSEEDVLDLFSEALEAGVPRLKQALSRRAETRAARPKVRLSISTDADPALVEVNGLLIGTTPIENFEVYQGDHLLTVGKPGYRDVTKRVLFERDLRIEVPMIRVELDAAEIKEVLEKMRLHVVIGEPALIIHALD